jgi:asparagine synthase (glutamine-hydrolysing)
VQGLLAHFQSLITPEDRWERLPAVFCGGKKVLLWDGRLDNREDLIRSLRLPKETGIITDGAIVAAALRHWGDDACRHLLGDFAFACWDMEERRLILASDHIGGRVILYHVNSQRIVFATSMDALYGFPELPLEIDLASLARVLVDAPPAPGTTMFKAVKQLPPAGYLVWSSTGVTVKRYWAPEVSKRLRYSSDESYVEHARELLDTAVRCRLRTTGPIVSQLSGGLDSSAVTSTAARIAGASPVFSVTAVAQEGVPVCLPSKRIFVDEWAHASAVAAAYPNLTTCRVPASPVTNDDPRHLFYARGMPVRNFMNASWFGAANEAVRAVGARTLLVGMAGNLTLTWNGRRRLADLACGAKLWALNRELRGLATAGIGRPWDSIRRDVLSRTVMPGLRRIRDWMRGSNVDWRAASAISTELGATQNVHLILEESIGRIPGLTHDSSLRLRYFEDMWRRPGNALLRSYLGFERWDPLADVRLIEFCIAIPPEQYLLDGVPRRLARRVLADRVPAEVLGENRKGRQSPEWFHRMNCGRKHLAATLERLKRSPLAGYALDLPKIKAAVDDWPADANAAQARYGSLVLVLARGINVGEFLEWAEGGCARPSGIPVPLPASVEEQNDAAPVYLQ